MASAGDDGRVQVWDADTGKPLALLQKFAAPVSCVRFDPGQGRRLLAGCDDGTVRLYQLATGEPVLLQTLRHGGAVTAAAFSPDGGRRILTAGVEGTAQVWDAETGQRIGPLVKHRSRVVSARFSPDGRWFATAGDDNTARVWEADSGRPITPSLPGNGNVVQALFRPDGAAVLTVSQDHLVRLWDLTDVDPTRAAPAIGGTAEAAKEASSAGLVTIQSQDHALAATFGNDPAVRGPAQQRRRAGGAALRLEGRVSAAAFRPDGGAVAAGGEDGSVQVWELPGGKPVFTEKPRHGGKVLAVAFSASGLMLATGSDDNTARVWEATCGASMLSPLRHSGSVDAVGFGDGDRVLVTSQPGRPCPAVGRGHGRAADAAA